MGYEDLICRNTSKVTMSDSDLLTGGGFLRWQNIIQQASKSRVTRT